MSVPTAHWRPLIASRAKFYDLPAWPQAGTPSLEFAPEVWFEALFLHESSGNPNARHYDEWASAKYGNGADDGDFEDWASYGLGQVEGATFRKLFGIPSDIPYNFAAQLYLPDTCMVASTRLILPSLAHYRTIDEVLADYNGGPNGAVRGQDGLLADQPYVELVRAAARLVQADYA